MNLVETTVTRKYVAFQIAGLTSDEAESFAVWARSLGYKATRHYNTVRVPR